MNKTEHEYYKMWARLKDSCDNPKHNMYYQRGAIGVKLAPEFYDFWTFVDYVDNNLDPRPGMDFYVTRIDNDGNFEPGNLKWGRKRARTRKVITLNPHRSLYVGVCFDKKGCSKPYKAQIVINYQNYHLGYFSSETEAAKAYDAAARKIGRKTNFIEE